jgi:integrase
MGNRIGDGILTQFEDSFYLPYFIKFIELKRGKGEKVKSGALYNMKFINNVFAKFEGKIITKQMIDKVLELKAETLGRIPDNLVSTLRQFTYFMSLFDDGTYVVPDGYVPFHRRPFHAFIFTKDELDNIILAADNFGMDCPMLHHKFAINPHPFIVRMLIGTGMRIGEVLKLCYKDFDLDRQIVNVIDGKSHVSRFVPLSESLAKEMKHYLSMSNPEGIGGLLVFRSSRTGDIYSPEGMKYFFYSLFKTAEVVARDGEKPTTHSFRHTFCTNSLKRMLAGGMDFYTALPILSAYMGHVNTIDTEKYIHLTGFSIEEFNNQQERLNSLIPEVGSDE